MTAATGGVRSAGPSDPWPRILPQLADWLALRESFPLSQQVTFQGQHSLMLMDMGFSLIHHQPQTLLLSGMS